MAIELRLTELIPPLFDSAVQSHTQRVLLPAEKEAILIGVVNSMRWSVLRRARGVENSEQVFKVEYLETSDRFDNHWMPRSEIVNRLSVSSGLDVSLASLSLFFIEMRIDLFLMSNEDLFVEGLGTFTIPKDRFPFYEFRRDIERRYSEVLWALHGERNVFSWSAPSSLRTRSGMARLLEWVEISGAFAHPAPYNIALAPHLVFIRGFRAQPEEEDLPEGIEHFFTWKGRDETDERDGGALGTA